MKWQMGGGRTADNYQENKRMWSEVRHLVHDANEREETVQDRYEKVLHKIGSGRLMPYFLMWKNDTR